MFRRASALTVLALCLVLPQQALAATNFYASQSGTGDCLTTTTPCSLPTAVHNAGLTSGGNNVVVLGPLTHTSSLTLPEGGVGGNPIHLIGSGSGAGGTFIDVSSSNALVLTSGSTAENLRVRGTGGAVLIRYGCSLTGAVVESTGAGSMAVTSQFSGAPGEAVIDRSTLTAPATGYALAAGNGGAGHSLIVRDSKLSAGTGITSVINIDAVVAQRNTIDASKVGVQIGLADGFISDSIVRMSGAASKGVDVPNPAGPGTPVALIHNTIDGTSTTGASVGVNVAEPSSLPANAATVKNSIIRGFATDLKAGGPQGTISATQSDFATAPGATDGGGNLNVDPAWVDRAGGDYRLSSGSPLIDSAGADPIDTGARESATDRAGNGRILDGNNDGSALRDMGALEFLYVPPTPPPDPGPGTGSPGPGLPLTPFTLRSGTLQVSGTSVKVPVACAATAAAACQIAVTIKSTKPLTPRVRAAARKKRKKILVFGRGKATVAPGKKGSVKVKLTRKARSLLRAHKLSKVSVTASIVPGAATAQNATRTYKIKPAKKKRRRR